jgi:hypothetical protein
MFNLFDIYKNTEGNEQDIFTFHSAPLQQLEQELDILEMQLSITRSLHDNHAKMLALHLTKKIDNVSYKYSAGHVSVWAADIARYEREIVLRKDTLFKIRHELMETHIETITTHVLNMAKQHLATMIPDSNAENVMKLKIKRSLAVLMMYYVLPMNDIPFILNILSKYLPKVKDKITGENPYNLIITMLMLATKFYIDVPYNNKSWGKFYEGTLSELNNMELKVITAIGIIDKSHLNGDHDNPSSDKRQRMGDMNT